MFAVVAKCAGSQCLIRITRACCFVCPTDESGTGIGPTLEFFSLLASELRLKAAHIWLSGGALDNEAAGEDTVMAFNESATAMDGVEYFDEDDVDESQPSTSTRPPPRKRRRQRESTTLIPPSPFVIAPHGLFPCPFPGDCVPDVVLRRFYVMGIAVAKCLQVSTVFLRSSAGPLGDGNR